MQQTIDALPYHIAIIDLDGYIQFVNKTWEQYAIENGGSPERTGPGINYLDVLENGNAKADARGLRAILNGEKTYYESKYPCHTPAEQRWFYFHARPLIRNGDITGAVISHRDIGTNEFEQHDIYQLLESTNDAFYALDHSFRFTFVNQKAEEEMQCSRSELLGKTIWEMFPAMIDSDFEQPFYRAMNKRVPVQFEGFYAPKESWYEMAVNPYDSGGLTIFFRNKNKEKYVDSLLWQSQHVDTMTGLPNRRHIYYYMTQLIENGDAFSVFYFDLDDFQLINDVYGHDFGDDVMQEAASRLRWFLDETMFLGRLGGDEFIIIAKPDAAVEMTEEKSEKLARLFDIPFYTPDEKPIQVRTSISCASYPADGDSPSAMITAVDTAMHEAKKQREKDGVVIYQQTMKEKMKRRIAIEHDLFDHVESGAYYLVYQPQVSLMTGEIFGTEVLSRWNHPVYGYIPPPEFIALAESAGKSIELTKRIIEAGLRDYLIWFKKAKYNGKIAFNISASMLSDEGFKQFLIDTKTDYGIADGVLELEITENAQLTASAPIKDTLADLRHAGFTIAVDDFGTGYSSLDYLIDFPIDILKIDKTFIDQIGVSKRGENVLRSLISLGKSLGLEIIAEGLETEDEWRFLGFEGCRLAQGYYFDKPLRHRDFLARLQQRHS